MDSYLAGIERDGIINSLDFRLGAINNLITERRSVSFYPSGSNIYTPVAGTTLLKFNITDPSAWIDPSTLRVQFTINNRRDRPLLLLNNNAANFFTRLIIRCNGVQIEDLQYYNRLTNMLLHLMPASKKVALQAEGLQNDEEGPFERIYTHGEFKNYAPLIPGLGKLTVMMPLFIGLMNCGKYLPLRFLQGLSIELILVPNIKDAVLKGPLDFRNDSEPLWEITEPVIKCQTVTLDNQAENDFTQMLRNGGSFPIHYTSFITQVANVGNTPTPSVAITRSFTRLKKLLYQYVEEDFCS